VEKKISIFQMITPPPPLLNQKTILPNNFSEQNIKIQIQTSNF